MGQKLREDCDAAKRVRRARMVFDRMIDAVMHRTRELERGDTLEGDVVKDAKALLLALSVLVSLELKLDDFKIESAGGVGGREPPMDLSAARVEIMGRLARLAERA
jgi:hypothetical protein